VILAAWYLLTAFRKIAQGPITNPDNDSAHLTDLRPNEIALVVPLVVLFFVIGLFPNLFLDKINPSVQQLLENPAIVRHFDAPEETTVAVPEIAKAEQ
jgi:NADH-quinone oxidoreductase subunit M